MTKDELHDRAEAICADLKGRIPVNLREEIEAAIVELAEEAAKDCQENGE